MPTTKDIAYATRAGEKFSGKLVQPGGDGKLPGLVLITAIFGIDDEMLELAQAWAEDGFIVSMPDYFWRQTPGPTADMDVAFERMNAYDQASHITDIEDVINDLRAHPRHNGKTALLGFCFGGWIAHVSAARYGIDAAAAFHGTQIGRYLDETANVRCPVSFHFGDNDPAVPMEEVARIEEAYKPRPNADIVTHKDCEHNFAMPYKPGYNAQAAQASRRAVLDCFRSM